MFLCFFMFVDVVFLLEGGGFHNSLSGPCLPPLFPQDGDRSVLWRSPLEGSPGEILALCPLSTTDVPDERARISTPPLFLFL